VREAAEFPKGAPEIAARDNGRFFFGVAQPGEAAIPREGGRGETSSRLDASAVLSTYRHVSI
jgi:hypothetical protein